MAYYHCDSYLHRHGLQVSTVLLDPTLETVKLLDCPMSFEAVSCMSGSRTLLKCSYHQCPAEVLQCRTSDLTKIEQAYLGEHMPTPVQCCTLCDKLQREHTESAF